MAITRREAKTKACLVTRRLLFMAMLHRAGSTSTGGRSGSTQAVYVSSILVLLHVDLREAMTRSTAAGSQHLSSILLIVMRHRSVLEMMMTTTTTTARKMEIRRTPCPLVTMALHGCSVLNATSIPSRNRRPSAAVHLFELRQRCAFLRSYSRSSCDTTESTL